MDESQIPSKYGYWARSAFEQARKQKRIASKFKYPLHPSPSYHIELADRYNRASWYFLFLDEFYKTEHEE